MCRNGSVFTSINPGGWWDTGSPSNLYRVILSEINEATFTSNYDGSFNPASAYMNDNGDIIPVYWQTFGDRIVLSTSQNYETNIKIFPNPTNDFLYYEIDNPELISEINIYDLNGEKQNSQHSDNSLNLKMLTSGIYFVEFLFKDNRKEIQQIIKL
ncbi:T9SS type A sorting domain-containing protein [Aequorivita sublithincola]|uniref:T9SS type A sorting domain-containing protein n=1 Tax=Aequorivita sublithincola TaxID=101385 RepID=UPI00031676F0|nr:T9SS type A sorting domain-containing protein [Aequorivita sublithincola]